MKITTVVKELLIGFGFLNGIWVAIGIRPGDIIIEILNRNSEYLPAIVRWVLVIVPIIALLITIYMLLKVYKRGGVLGSFAVFIAFVSGTLILQNLVLSLILLGIAIALGWITFKRKQRKKKYRI